MRVFTPRALEFACRSAACRPPTSGGTGGSSSGGKGGNRPSPAQHSAVAAWRKDADKFHEYTMGRGRYTAADRLKKKKADEGLKAAGLTKVDGGFKTKEGKVFKDRTFGEWTPVHLRD